jgi:hypothetical protein
MPVEGIPFKKMVEGMETKLIVRSLEIAGGVQKRAAELLQIKPTTLNEMIKRYGIQPRRKRRASASTTEAPSRKSRSENESVSTLKDVVEKRFP